MRGKYKFLGWLLAAVIVVPAVYVEGLNLIGPSTEYLEPSIPNARDIDGKPTVYVGDDFFVRHTIVRHRLNGNCILHIDRYAQDVDGPTPGRKTKLDEADLQFKGDNEVLHPRWPPESRALPDILPKGVDQVTMDFYVVARYYCNFMDNIIPRYLQGLGNAHRNEGPRVRAVVRRRT